MGARWVLGVAAALAVVLVGLLAIFMIDPAREERSVLPGRRFFVNHSCLSAYTEAARLAPSGANVYDPAEYADLATDQSRFIGRFEVDLYLYPPSFLALPRAVVAAGVAFTTIRTAWFVVQVALLLGAMIALARWIGGRCGAAALALVPLVWLAPTTRVGLQMGNFHLTAVPLAILAMLAFERRRAAVGGAALGFVAVSKIFPGALGVLLLVDRRWRAVAWTVAGAALVTALAIALVGTAPFVDFVHYQVPRLRSGEAVFWIDRPEMAPVNQSIAGLVTKLRVLGVPGTGPAVASAVSSIYALLVVAAAVVGARRLRRLVDADPSLVRLRTGQLWLGLLGLASFRSPFVPDAYGLVSTLWLLTLLGAERPRRPVAIGLAVAAVTFCLILDGGWVPTPVPAALVVATLAIQLAAIAINARVVLAPDRLSARARAARSA